MVSQEEQSLTETLVDPENLDPPNGSVWTKGTKQPNQCRDAWAAILFYAQFIAIAVVAGMLGVPAVNKATDDGSSSTFQKGASSSTTDYTGLLYGERVDVHHLFDVHQFANSYILCKHRDIIYSLINCRRMLLRIQCTLPLRYEYVSKSFNPDIITILVGIFSINSGSILLLWEYSGWNIWYYILLNFMLLRLLREETHSICCGEFEYGANCS